MLKKTCQLGILLAVCFAIPALTAQSAELKSGLQVGEKISGLRVTNCSSTALKKKL